jgi:hypothetical protein
MVRLPARVIGIGIETGVPAFCGELGPTGERVAFPHGSSTIRGAPRYLRVAFTSKFTFH